MDNINAYDEIQFQKNFTGTELHQRLSRDFDFLHWHDHWDMYAYPTPRQLFGDPSIRIFSVVPIYYLSYLLDKNPIIITDLGCGWNIFKKYLPNVIGIGEEDPTTDSFYGDLYGQMNQEFIDQHQNHFESIFSINALHFISLSDIRQRVLDFISIVKPGGRGFLALNSQRMVDNTPQQFLVDNFGFYRPNGKDLDRYIRDNLTNLPCNVLVFDIDVDECSTDIMNGNIRLVFER